MNWKKLCEKVKANKKDLPKEVYIYGRGSFGVDLSNACRVNDIVVHGFIDLRAPELRMPDTVSPSDIKKSLKNVSVMIGVFNRNVPFSEISEMLLDQGLQEEDIYYPWDYYHFLRDYLGWRYWLESPDYLLRNKKNLDLAHALFDEKRSIRILESVINFRLGLDVDFSRYQSRCPQYFNKLTSLIRNLDSQGYIDIGAFDGDTYFHYREFLGADASAVLLEPDFNNYRKLVSNLNLKGASDRVTILPCAASSETTMLSFASGKGEGSYVSKNGDRQVLAIALDETMRDFKAGFIKIDVEGAEISVLSGMQNMIRNSRPILSISLYHNPWDLWEIPQYIQKIFKGECKLYLRQHMANSFDLVLYVIPR